MSAESQLFSQRQQQNEGYNRAEDYAQAKRAAVEATLVGRETIEAALRQGEQLQNAEQMADETEYTLDRASRVLRGMTWAGWWANKFTSDVKPPDYSNETTANASADGTVYLPPKVYENVPEVCMPAAQAIQNYHANLQVLETCETSEQKETCRGICDSMYMNARREVTKLLQRQQMGNENSDMNFSVRLGKDLKVLRERHDRVGDNNSSRSGPSTSNAKSALFGTVAESQKIPSPKQEIEQQQDDHLDFMSKHLNELGSLATTLNTSLAQHAETLDSLDEKSDAMLFKSKMVTRRTDYVIQKKSWTKAKKEFLYEGSIRHIASGRFLAVNPTSNTLQLSDKLNETCIFSIWQRQTAAKVFGLQSKHTRRWVGQSLLGYLACSAYSFDRREEWDADHGDWSRTPLLCASAGWGNGAYLLLQKDNDQLTLGTGGLKDKKIADLWCIESYDHHSSARSTR
jgi:hypothetical protein